jgi:hypothetical protein
MVRKGAARMLKPTTKAVTAPEKESDRERSPCTLSRVAIPNGIKGKGAMMVNKRGLVRAICEHHTMFPLHK